MEAQTYRADRPPVRSPIKRRRDAERAIQEHVIPANKLKVELAQGRFDTWTRFLPMDGAAFHVVIIEEFERVVTRFDRCFRSMRDFVNTFRLLETRGIILRQQGKHTGGKPPWGYRVVGPRSNPVKGVKGNRRLEPDWEERALMLEIVRLRDLERIPCWETIAARMRQMQRDARRGGIDNPALFRREWSWESCQRAYAAFWTVLVAKEGTSWIADPTIKNLADVRLAKR